MPPTPSPRRRLIASLVALALTALLPCGCKTTGADFAEDKIPRIEKGVTTREQVDGWFGRPVHLEQRASGFAVYKYYHEEQKTRDTGVFTRMAAFIAGFFGFRGHGSPLNVRYDNRIKHELIIAFDPDGIVSSFGYERTELPSKQIY
jgi:outer membrane protein assembly factor BamE (lipoprotein component of BamABCDE complex)